MSLSLGNLMSLSHHLRQLSILLEGVTVQVRGSWSSLWPAQGLGGCDFSSSELSLVGRQVPVTCVSPPPPCISASYLLQTGAHLSSEFSSGMSVCSFPAEQCCFPQLKTDLTGQTQTKTLHNPLKLSLLIANSTSWHLLE